MMSRHYSNAGLPYRPSEGRFIAGVCAGLSRYANVDVTFVRLAFLLLAFAWAIGVFLYLAAWAIMPDERELGSSRMGWKRRLRYSARSARLDLAGSRVKLHETWQRAGRDPWPRPLGRRWLAIALIALGLGVLLASLGALNWLTGTRALGLAIAAAGIAVLLTMRRD